MNPLDDSFGISENLLNPILYASLSKSSKFAIWLELYTNENLNNLMGTFRLELGQKTSVPLAEDWNLRR